MKLGTKLTIALVLGLLIIGGVSIQSYLGIQRLTQTNRLVVHTHEVLENLEHVLSVLKDAETGQRGYILTGQDRYLEPYNLATKAIQSNIATVQILTSDNPQQQKKLQQLEKLSSDKLNELQETVKLRKESGQEAALAIIRTDRGERIMDDIRSLIDQMESSERQLLDARSRAASQAAQRTFLAIIVGATLSAMILAAAAIIVIRTMRMSGAAAIGRDTGRKWPGIVFGYSFAVVIVALATGARLWLERNIGPMPLFATWYPAVLLVAIIGGGGPGILATLLSAAVADYWFTPPYGQFTILRANDAVALGIFTGTCTFLSLLAERMHRARWAEAVSVVQQQELALMNMGNLMALDLDHRIVRWSEGNRRLYGFEAQEAQGQFSYELLHTDFSLPLEQIHRELHAKDFWEGEVTRKTKAGATLAIAILWALQRDQRGQPLAILEVSTDITARKRAEENLRQTAQELARSNKDLEQFAYVASHDLQEPLRQVRSFVQILQDRFADKFEGQAGEYMEFVRDGAIRMNDLVRGLLDYSRVGAKDSPRQPVACQQSLDAALANLKTSIAESHARITHDELPTIEAEPLQLTQLFQNLIGNAIKFRRDDVPPEIHVGCRREGEGWQFWVRDNGIGIAPEFQQKVFMIFQRLHVREKYPGTGIGLSICKKIVERHGGKIWIESKAGHGTTFYFTLPEDHAS